MLGAGAGGRVVVTMGVHERNNMKDKHNDLSRGRRKWACINTKGNHEGMGISLVNRFDELGELGPTREPEGM